MKNRTLQISKEQVDAEVARRRNEYAENESYRIAMEEEFARNPKSMKYSEGFYRLGEGRDFTKHALLFPVKVVDGRKLFGKLQCLITPICIGVNFFVAAPLGKKWVDRKFLIFKHDHEFSQYKAYLNTEIDEEL